MEDINPILDSPKCVSEYLPEVPQYVLDVRKELEKELAIQMDRKIKKTKVPKTKISKQKTLTHKKISHKAFNSFIDTEYPKPAENSLETTGSIPIGRMGDDAIQDLRNLIELAKTASGNQDSKMADLFYELKELKEKEIGIIYNYIKHR